MNISHRRATTPSLSEGKVREEAWRSAPTIAERFPDAGTFAIAMAFKDPRGGTPSPRRQLYEPSMRAFFELRCPMQQCAGGGFDLDVAVRAMLSGTDRSRTGHAICHGKRGSEECRLELTYSLVPDPEGDGA